jgi:ferric-dicitrate binding protein FerR (iron transport regulator)
MTELPRDDAEYLRIIEGQVGDDPGAQRAARLLALAESVVARPPALDVDGGWQELSARMATRRALRWLEVAGGLAALIVFAVVTYVTVAPVIVGHVDERYEATATAPLTVRMPDGSRATLTPLARVRYRASYFHPPRSLTLEGEARFFVRPDGAHPFEVHAGAATITATGTVFTVRANPWETTVHVSVEEGAVAVAPVHRLVHAGEELIVGR